MKHPPEADMPPVRLPRIPKPQPPGGSVDRYPKLAAPRRVLDQLRIDHLELAEQSLMAAGGNLYLPDLIITAMLQRSYGVIDALIDAVDTYNIHVAAPLLRLQLDTLFRAHYIASEPDVDNITMRLLRGEELRKIKDADGKPLNDYRLKELAGQTHAWALPVYDKASGWVHFSVNHMHATVQVVDTGGFHMGVPLRADVIPESLWHEIYGAAIQATKELFAYVRGWATRKGMPSGQARTLSNVRKERARDQSSSK
jgi:hypothetical protein